jgi:Glycosyltransferase
LLVLAGHRDRGVLSFDHPAIRDLGAVAEADLPALYSDALIFVYPSRYEGFGLPPLEAMACGAAVICSRAGSLPEVVGDAALLIDPDDPGALAAAIDRVLADTALRAALSDAGRRRAATFSWQRTAEETLAVYARAVR